MYFARIREAALVLAMLVLFVGCGQQSETKNEAPDDKTTDMQITEQEESGEAKDKHAETHAKEAVAKKAASEAEHSKTDHSKQETLTKKPSKPNTVTVAIPAGMNVVISLTETIETGQNSTGDSFSGTLVDPIVIAGKTVFTSGTKVRGTILNAVGSGRLKTDAELSLTLQRIANVDVQTDVIEDKASSHADRNKKLIGGGALIGGVLGALKGKNVKGAITGAAAGAAAGTGAAALTGKKNLRYEEGTLLQFTLAKPAQATIPR
jgi:hypothetical protein